MATAANQKALGAFYTSHSVATSLVKWAISGAGDSVLDPSCGEGIFLAAARDRLSRLGNVQPKIWGVDSDPGALAMAKSSASACKILHSDFFFHHTRIDRPILRSRWKSTIYQVSEVRWRGTAIGFALCSPGRG